jgi:hypothetical protein
LLGSHLLGATIHTHAVAAKMLGVMWYGFTLASAFVLLVARIGPRLSFGELALASVPVGTIGGAWLFYLCACLLSNME